MNKAAEKYSPSTDELAEAFFNTLIVSAESGSKFPVTSVVLILLLLVQREQELSR